MSLVWTTLEDALVAWAGAIFGSGQVIWADQQGPQPDVPYATLKITGPHPATSTPELRLSEDPEEPPGAEIRQTVIDHAEITVTLQAYSNMTTGPRTARELVQDARLRLHLPAQRAAFDTVGLALVDVGDTQDLTALLETTWQSRAALDVRFNVVDTATETATYIETVTTTGSFT